MIGAITTMICNIIDLIKIKYSTNIKNQEHRKKIADALNDLTVLCGAYKGAFIVTICAVTVYSIISFFWPLYFVEKLLEQKNN